MFLNLYKFCTMITLVFLASCGNYDGPNGGYDDSSSLCIYVDIEQLSSEKKLDVPYEAQDFNYCGPASLSMVLNYLGVDTDQYEIGEGIVTKYGVSPWDIKNIAISYGFKSSVISCSLNNLMYIIDKLNVPVIVRVISNTGLNGHYIVVTGYDIKKELIYVNDPGNAYKKQISFVKFKEMWDINQLSYEENSSELMILVKK